MKRVDEQIASSIMRAMNEYTLRSSDPELVALTADERNFIAWAVGKAANFPRTEIEAEFVFRTPDGYIKRYPVEPVSISKIKGVITRTYSMTICEYVGPTEVTEVKA